jgi:hypothetical protein
LFFQENPDLWKWLTGQEQPPDAVTNNPVLLTSQPLCTFLIIYSIIFMVINTSFFGLLLENRVKLIKSYIYFTMSQKKINVRGKGFTSMGQS